LRLPLDHFWELKFPLFVKLVFLFWPVSPLLTATFMHAFMYCGILVVCQMDEKL